MRKKQWKDLERQKNVKGEMKVALGIETKQKVYFRSGWFSSRKIEQDGEFRSEGLQVENNEREARERQYNQLIIQNQQMQAQQSQAIQTLQQ